jgi:hypothetical protein
VFEEEEEDGATTTTVEEKRLFWSQQKQLRMTRDRRTRAVGGRGRMFVAGKKRRLGWYGRRIS